MNKFMKKLAKKTEGFTLVELIVVIAILGILAAVAVPAYSGYLDKAEEAGDITALSAIKTAAIGAYAENGAIQTINVVVEDDGDITTITATGDGDPASISLYASSAFVTTTDEGRDFQLFLNEMPKLSSKSFTGGTIKWATNSDWAKS